MLQQQHECILNFYHSFTLAKFFCSVCIFFLWDWSKYTALKLICTDFTVGYPGIPRYEILNRCGERGQKLLQG